MSLGSDWPPRPIAVPRLKTERLTLRAPTPEDASAIFEILQNWDVVRWTASIPYPYDDVSIAETWIDASAERAEKGEAAVFAICAPNLVGDRYIGSVELKIEPVADDRRAEVGYYLEQDWWGGGYTAEAVGAALDVGFDHLGLETIVGLTRLDNRRSSRVLEKLGFTHQGFESRFAKERDRYDELNRFALSEQIWRRNGRNRLGETTHG